jgi:hypothetical protein
LQAKIVLIALKEACYMKVLFKIRKTGIFDRKILKNARFSVVPVVGVEPTRYCYHGILSPARLPIPPHRRK